MRKEEALHGVKKKMNIIQTLKRRKTKAIGHILKDG